MSLEQAIIDALRGDAVLFIGAGFPYKAQNSYPPPDNAIPDARAFAKQLVKSVGSSGDYDLPVIGQYYISKKGEHNLLNEISSSFSTSDVQQYHIDIASMPWRRVYTTNYDNCFEFAGLQAKKKWSPTTIDTDPSGAKKLCVHVNGHITNLTIKSLSTQVKLTHSSYSADAFASTKWAQQLRQDFNNAKAVIFIGYSLSDIDISRILYCSPELVERTHFIVAPGADEITTAPLAAYGTVHAIGIEKFSQKISATDVPTDLSKYSYTWLRKYDSEIEPAEPDDIAGIDLLTLGVVDQQNVAWDSADDTPHAYIKRSEISEILKELEAGRRWFLVHSDLGNGKTILKHQISHLLSRLGYTVYWDSDFELNRATDIQHMSEDDEKTAIFIDESSDRFDVIDGLLSVNVENVVVFVNVRTTLYELGESKYEEYLPSDYIPLDINRLTDADVESFVGLLNALGLWGERARLSYEEKKGFVSVDCGRAISKVIISIFEQSEVGKRIESTARKALNGKNDAASLVVLSFLLNQIGHTPRLTMLSEILGKDAWKIVRSDEFDEAGEFVRFAHGKVKARSSVVSAYLLRRALKAELLLINIERFVRRMASLKRDRALHHVFTELQRFPVIERIIDSPSKEQLIIGYFQSLKNLAFCQNNALFWLHYAMARLSYGEFKEATLYFEQAKSLAKGNPKETTDVNNQFAKMLLESRTNSSEYDDYYEAFVMAHKILLDQMNRNTNRHFPFRQAKNYVSFIAFRKKDMDQTQIDRFSVCCKQVLSAITHLDGKISRSREVDECRVSIERAIEIAESAD